MPKLVSRNELKNTYGIPYSLVHISRLESQGKFPKRVRLGASRVTWVAEEVEAWVAEHLKPTQDYVADACARYKAEHGN